MTEVVLYESHPSTFRNRPFRYLLVCVLCLAIVGIFILLYWWIVSRATKLTVTDKRTSLKRGLLSRHLTEVYHADVRNIELKQSVMQRIFNVGSIGISSAGQSGMEIYVEGMPEPDRIREIVNAHRRSGGE